MIRYLLRRNCARKLTISFRYVFGYLEIAESETKKERFPSEEEMMFSIEKLSQGYINSFVLIKLLVNAAANKVIQTQDDGFRIRFF